MTRITFMLMSLVFSQTSLIGQVQKGAVEISLQGAFGTMLSTAHSVDLQTATATVGTPVRYGSGFLRVGYFVWKRLEADYEIHWLVSPVTRPTRIHSINLSYNLVIDSWRVVPFALVGGGLAPEVSPPLDQSNRKHSPTYGAFNLGLGVRYLISNAIALRAEYRHQSLTSFEFGFRSYSPVMKSTEINYNNILLGVSVFP